MFKYLLISLLFINAFDAKAAVDRDIVSAAETHLNSFKTLQAKFYQTNPDGSTSSGNFYMQRPGKFRLDYFQPSQFLLMSTGYTVVNYDKNVGDPYYISLDDMPALSMLSATVKFSGDTKVVETFKQGKYAYISLVKTKEPENGSLTLVFAQKPYKLVKWIVVDPDGKKTLVELENTKTGLEFDAKLFKFEK